MPVIKLGAIHEKSLYPPLAQAPGSGSLDQGQARHYRELNIAKTLAWLEQAGRQKLDLVCTRESMSGSLPDGLEPAKNKLALELAEPVPGPLTEKLGRIGRRYGMYIAANFYERAGSLVYNTSVLLDRQGRLCGSYRKAHLPPREKWTVAAGDKVPVFATDLGRVGFAICYDICFPEHTRTLALAGAELVIHQTMGWGSLTSVQHGAALLQARALDNSIYLLVAKNIQPINAAWASSCLIDNRGDFLAKAGGEEEALATASFVPDYARLEEDHFNSLFSGIASSRARLYLERRPDLYGIISSELPDVCLNYRHLADRIDSPEGQAENKAAWQEYNKARSEGRAGKSYHW